MKNTICTLVALTFFLTGATGVAVGVYVLYYGEVKLHGVLIGGHK